MTPPAAISHHLTPSITKAGRPTPSSTPEIRKSQPLCPFLILKPSIHKLLPNYTVSRVLSALPPELGHHSVGDEWDEPILIKQWESETRRDYNTSVGNRTWAECLYLAVTGLKCGVPAQLYKMTGRRYETNLIREIGTKHVYKNTLPKRHSSFVLVIIPNSIFAENVIIYTKVIFKWQNTLCFISIDISFTEVYH